MDATPILLTGRLERLEPQFREIILGRSRFGMILLGALSWLVVGAFVSASWMSGKTIGWSYGAHDIVLVDKVVIVAIGSLSALVAMTEFGARAGRYIIAVVLLIVEAATLLDDVSTGDISFAPGFVMLAQVAAVAVMPYRPLQTLALTIAIGIEYYLLLRFAPAFGLPPAPIIPGHLAYLAMVGVLLTGISWFLYRSRYLQHLSRRRVEELELRVEALFGQQVSAEVARAMIDSEAELESKSYNVTVMFLDIRDFTVFAEWREPAEVARFQNLVFGELIEIVRHNGGLVLQILGDGLLAVFGAPVVRPDHAERAVRAGMEMIDRVAALGDEGRIPHIRIGIGLHSGDVIAGNLGNAARKFYSLTGKTVIVAARVEPLNKKYGSQMLVTDCVWRDVADLGYEAKEIGAVALKGIEEPVPLYQLR